MKTPERLRSTTTLVADVLGHVSTLIRKELDLARAEVGERAQRASNGLTLIVLSIIAAVVALNLIARALIDTMAARGIDPVWAGLGLGAVLAIAALMLASRGIGNLRSASAPPKRAMERTKRDLHGRGPPDRESEHG